METIQTLRNLQNAELQNGFVNGQLYNDLEDMIYKLENNLYKEIETIHADAYGAKQLKK